MRRPGEMFVVRNIAGLAPPYETSRDTMASPRHSNSPSTQLKVAEIMVMGHGLCGGCAAALTGNFDHTPHGARPFHRRLGADAGSARATRCARGTANSIAKAFLDMEWEAVKVALANLRTFPWIAERETAGEA